VFPRFSNGLAEEALPCWRRLAAATITTAAAAEKLLRGKKIVPEPCRDIAQTEI
jgi:hypothetical protein